MARTVLFSCLVCLLAGAVAAAQQPPAQTPATDPLGPGGTFNGRANFEELEPGHWRYVGQVDFDLGQGMKLFADLVDYYTDDAKLVASGNVVFTNPEGRLSAEQVEFNIRNQTGTFHQAFGIMSLGDHVDRAQFGGQDPDVYFYGDTIEKLGPRRYKVTRGGFTTCVQPTPRWEIVSGSVTLNLNDYAIASNTLLKVKGVPLFYLPVLYYPIQDDDRATGFLLPTYGTSTIRGQAISNAFFWAIDRSQDVTFFHDWFTRTGQGFGSEYRYVAGPQSLGNVQFYRFQQKDSTFTDGGQSTVLPANTIYRISSAVTQQVGATMRAQANVDYFSDVALQQLYYQNVYQATQRQRRIAGGLSGASGPLSAGIYYSRTEIFSSNTSSSIYGTTPRMTANLAPQRLFGSPVYAALNTDYSYAPNRARTAGTATSDFSFGRFDVAPTLRAPLSKLTFLSVNSTAGYRLTAYSKSLAGSQLVPESLRRQYFTTRTEAIGPVFTKIWDTPGSTSIQRMKHVVEPTFAFDYITEFANQTQVPRYVVDPSDYVIGGATRLTYGITNRLLYRSRQAPGSIGGGSTREFLTVGIQQTYYTNPASSREDTQYVSRTFSARPATLSPIAVVGRISPTSTVDANTRIEYDMYGNGLQSITGGGSINGAKVSGNVTYNRTRLSSTDAPSSYISGSATARDKRLQGTYALSWDVARGYIVTQSFIGSYMAQCCGLQFEFQNYKFPSNSGYPVSADRRFNFGFVLAGLGTFSNFFGAFGGGVR
jgi:LPS-assembly protein